MRFPRVPAFLFLAFFLIPLSLFAQDSSYDPLPLPSSSIPLELTLLPSTPSQPQHPVHHPGPHFYLSKNAHPLTPQQVAFRKSVYALGVDRHRFVRCELTDGTQLTGGILAINQQRFYLSQGILSPRWIPYSQLTSSPVPVPAFAEHLTNSLKWAGLVAFCIAAAPLAIAFYPLVLAGVLQD